MSHNTPNSSQNIMNSNINLNPVLISLNNMKKSFLFNQIVLIKAYKLQNKKNHEDCLKMLELVNNKMYDLGNFLDNLILTPVIIRDCREIISEKRRFLKRSIVKRLLKKESSSEKDTLNQLIENNTNNNLNLNKQDSDKNENEIKNNNEMLNKLKTSLENDIN